MPFVLDASVAASWMLPDETDRLAEAAFERLDADGAHAPALFWYELRNIFIVNERRGRMDAGQTQHALALLASLPITLDRAPDEGVVLALARRFRLSVYDAAYLELAVRRDCPLASLDTALMQAARERGVALVDV